MMRSPLAKRGLSGVGSLAQIVGKINRDADYEYSGATSPFLAATGKSTVLSGVNVVLA